MWVGEGEVGVGRGKRGGCGERWGRVEFGVEKELRRVREGEGV